MDGSAHSTLSMSQLQASSRTRQLTATEELEQLEQSITLTLQEIDHNFSRAHRTVTASIIPVIEQYANHSREVWNGARFWKQFFEASANVSLSGYEEGQGGAEQHEEQTVIDLSQSTEATGLESSETYETPQAQQFSNESIEDIDLSNLTLSPTHSTPRPTRPARTKKREPSPFHDVRRDRTPEKRTSILDDIAITPTASPPGETKPRGDYKPVDPLMHTVLDKNYRIQATPITSTKLDRRAGRTPVSSFRTRHIAEDNLESSPIAAPPQLTANIYSPVRPQGSQSAKLTSKTPPGRGREQDVPARQTTVWDSDDEDDMVDEVTGAPFGVSPPKTMQFHVPQSRLMQTPAREASKKIVDNILASAGMSRHLQDESIEDDFEIDLDIDEPYEMEDSPSVVRRKADLDTDIF